MSKATIRFETALEFLEGEDKDLSQALLWLKKTFDVVESPDEVFEMAKQLEATSSVDPEFKEKFDSLAGEMHREALRKMLADGEYDKAERYALSVGGMDPEIMVSLADHYAEGEAEEKTIEDAIPWYRKAAEQGECRAQAILAEMFFEGKRTRPNYEEAMKWASKAVEGWATEDLCLMLGKCYADGLGVDRDVLKAISFYEKALQHESWCNSREARDAVQRLVAEIPVEVLYDMVKFGPDASETDKRECRKVYIAAKDGSPEAEYEMGKILMGGMHGILIDKTEGFNWYLQAAEHGLRAAQSVVARFYSIGLQDVVSSDSEKSFRWRWAAAMQGDPEAMECLADCFFVGSGVVADKEEARAWLLRAAQCGNERALRRLREVMEEDDILSAQKALGCPGTCHDADEDDKAKFREWWQKANDGDADAQSALGWAFVCGEFGAMMNEPYGVDWLKKAVAQGNAEAFDRLGECYSYGWGVEKDSAKAMELYLTGVDKGNVECVDSLANLFEALYEKDEVGKEDQSKVLLSLKRLAESDCSLACYYLGRFYENGLGVDRDIEKAKELYQKAADAGDEDAKDALESLEK